jgi:hypothetical protein
MENSLYRVTVDDQLPADFALKLAAPLRGFESFSLCSVPSVLVKLGIVVRVTLCMPLLDDCFSLFERSALLREVADVLVRHPVIGRQPASRESHSAELVACERD